MKCFRDWPVSKYNVCVHHREWSHLSNLNQCSLFSALFQTSEIDLVKVVLQHIRLVGFLKLYVPQNFTICLSCPTMIHIRSFKPYPINPLFNPFLLLRAKTMPQRKGNQQGLPNWNPLKGNWNKYDIWLLSLCLRLGFCLVFFRGGHI